MSDRIDHITCHDNCSCQPHMQAAETKVEEMEDRWYLVKWKFASRGPEVLFKKGDLLFSSNEDLGSCVEGNANNYEFLNKVTFLSL